MAAPGSDGTPASGTERLAHSTNDPNRVADEVLVHDTVDPPACARQSLKSLNVPDELSTIGPVLHSVVLDEDFELSICKIAPCQPVP